MQFRFPLKLDVLQMLMSGEVMKLRPPELLIHFQNDTLLENCNIIKGIPYKYSNVYIIHYIH